MKLCSACKSEEVKEIEIVTKGAFIAIELKKIGQLHLKTLKLVNICV